MQDAIVSWMIDYAILNNKAKVAFDCALRITSAIEEGGCKVELTSITDGILDCFTNLLVSTGFRYLKKTNQYDILYRTMQDVRNYDIVVKKISEILKEETVEDFIQALIENGIRNAYKGEK